MAYTDSVRHWIVSGFYADHLFVMIKQKDHRLRIPERRLNVIAFK